MKEKKSTVTRIGAAKPIHTPPEISPNRDTKVLLKTPNSELTKQELTCKLREQIRILKKIKTLKDLEG